MTPQAPLQSSSDRAAALTALSVYILYIISIFVELSIHFGLAAIIGVIVAYVNRRDSPAWVKNHCSFQIRTFWIGLFFLTVCFALSLVFRLFVVVFQIFTEPFLEAFIASFPEDLHRLVFLPWMLWLVFRSAKGIKRLGQAKPFPSPII